MSDKYLIKSLPYLLGLIASGTGVNIKTNPQAITAGTDGNTIYFPPLPYQGGDLAIYAIGFLVHEAGHIRWTDFDCYQTAVKNSPLLRSLVNILEDVRIERLMNKIYPGAKHWLNGLTLKFVETGYQGVIEPSAPLAVQLVRYIQDWLFESVLDYSAVKGIGKLQRQHWRLKVTEKLADDIEALGLRAALASSTTEVVDLSQQIITLIQAELATTKEIQSNQVADGGQAADDGQVADDGDGRIDNRAKSGAYVQALQDLLETVDLDEGADRGDAIRAEMHAPLAAANALRQSCFILPTVLSVQAGAADPAVIASVRTASTALRYRLEEYLQARKRSRTSFAESGRRLAHDAGRRMAIGDPHIYQIKNQGQKVDTAVSLLIDLSSSMQVNVRYKVAIESALALGLALEDIDGVTYSVAAFPFHDFDVIDLVEPGENIRTVAGRFAVLAPNGSTPLDRALLHVHSGLLTTKASRRVCMVVTDGEPDDLNALVQVLSMGEAEGVEHMAIGIDSSAVHITKNSCIVNNLSDLPKKILSMMQDMILLPKAA